MIQAVRKQLDLTYVEVAHAVKWWLAERGRLTSQEASEAEVEFPFDRHSEYGASVASNVEDKVDMLGELEQDV